jgi:hypothetical protein
MFLDAVGVALASDSFHRYLRLQVNSPRLALLEALKHPYFIELTHLGNG